MPRQPAAVRHLASAPADNVGGETGTDLLEVLIAFHHPTRRMLAELLGSEGPAKVGDLAERAGVAVGTVSHHLKALHRHGFAEPAPDLARDSRESWWRATPRQVSWSTEDFARGSLGRRVADTAAAENFRYQVRAVQQWLDRNDVPDEDRRLGFSTDSFVSASREQITDLAERLGALVLAWSEECVTDRDRRPDQERIPVRVIARVFPSAPVRT